MQLNILRLSLRAGTNGARLAKRGKNERKYGRNGYLSRFIVNCYWFEFEKPNDGKTVDTNKTDNFCGNNHL